jgi:hypothetical protein
VNGFWRNHQQVEFRNIGEGVDFGAFADAERAATFQEKWDVGTESRRDFEETF